MFASFGISHRLICYAESPFEFRALEVALEAICSFLAARTTELETAAYPALDELTSKVCTLYLFLTTMISFCCQCRLTGLSWGKDFVHVATCLHIIYLLCCFLLNPDMS